MHGEFQICFETRFYVNRNNPSTHATSHYPGIVNAQNQEFVGEYACYPQNKTVEIAAHMKLTVAIAIDVIAFRHALSLTGTRGIALTFLTRNIIDLK